MHNDQLAEFIRMYKVQSWKENLFIIFGTWNVASALAVPAERTLPLRGLEWSFMNSSTGSSLELKGGNDTDNLL